MRLSEEDVQKILQIIDKLEFGEIRLESGDLELYVAKGLAGEKGNPSRVGLHLQERQATMAGATQATSSKETPPHAREDAHFSTANHLIRAPTSGIFYRAGAPNAEPFVEVGQPVSPESTVCMLEVMKLFSSVAAGVAGRISEVLVQNGVAVMEGQPLFGVDIG